MQIFVQTGLRSSFVQNTKIFDIFSSTCITILSFGIYPLTLNTPIIQYKRKVVTKIKSYLYHPKFNFYSPQYGKRNTSEQTQGVLCLIFTLNFD